VQRPGPKSDTQNRRHRILTQPWGAAKKDTGHRWDEDLTRTREQTQVHTLTQEGSGDWCRITELAYCLGNNAPPIECFPDILLRRAFREVM
jgi:hypothetical protein